MNIFVKLILLAAAMCRDPSPPFVSGDGFRAHSDYIYDETDRSLDPATVAPRSTIFLKTDYLGEFFSKVHPRIPGPYILITHNSDYSAPGKYSSYLNDPKLIAWFGQNIDRSHPKLHPIPIGVANRYWDHGNLAALQAGAAKAIPKSHLLYYNLIIQNYYAERSRVAQLFAKAPYCYSAPRKNFEGYLEDLKASKFILAPRGNGLDTHRLWEALYMGSYPIVKTSTLDSLYKDLPVVIVSRWEEVNEEFLQKKYAELENTPQSLDKASLAYWIDLINSYR